MKRKMTPTTKERMPSRMKIQRQLQGGGVLLARWFSGAGESVINYPWNPRMPSTMIGCVSLGSFSLHTRSVSYNSLFPMAEANRPPKAPAREVDEKKSEYRFCASVRLYHIPFVSSS